MSFWTRRAVLVTGGASFIGSNLVTRLIEMGARVRVADDFSSGRRENLDPIASEVEVMEGDLKDRPFAAACCAGQEVVFHLAADHGGRGYVDLHQWACATNLGLDQAVLSGCLGAGVEKVVLASSGCVYPNHIQTDTSKELYLTEDMVGPPYNPDGAYGLAKLACELSLKALHDEHGMSGAACRFFTVYGPNGIENHAVMAMIARAFLGEDPFKVWGTGEQVRNWTYISDIVSGTILAGELLDDASAVNLGTMERIRVIDAVRMVLEYTGHQAAIELQPGMPTGPVNRVADNTKALKVLGWEPEVNFATGLRKTIDWYFSTRDRVKVSQTLPYMLTERPADVRGLTRAET